MPKVLSFPAQNMVGGLNLQSIRNLEPEEISSGASVRYEKGSSIYTGPGFRTASDLGSSASVPAMREALVTSLLWAKSGTKVYYMTDPDSGTSYDSGITTTNTAGDYGWLHEQGNGDIFYINQTDAPARFAVAQLTIAVAINDTTFTVGADWIGKFTASGNVTVNGIVYAYTAKNATQLTGIPALAITIAINTAVIQSSTPATFPLANNGSFMFDFDGRLYTGGRLHYENILYGSAPEDSSNPQFFYDFQGNGTVQKVFSGKLTGGIKGIGRAYVFTNNQCFQFTGVDPTTGGTLFQPISQNFGAYNPRCIVDMEGTVAFFGRQRLIPITISLAPGGVSAPQLDANFDIRLRPWLSSLDADDQQADAKLHYDKVQQILKLQGRRGGALETYTFDRNGSAYGPVEVRSAKSFSIFKGSSYFGHVNNGKVYKDDTGLTNDGTAIYHAWATGEREDDKGRKYMQGYSVQYTGYMSKGCEHTFNVYVDGAATPSYSQIYTDSLIVEMIGYSLGSNGIPGSAIGGSQDLPKVFRYRNEVLLIGLSGESFRFEWITIKEGVFFSVSDYEPVVYQTAHNLRIRS